MFSASLLQRSISHLLLFVLCGVLSSPALMGATFTVTNTNDTGAGSLRKAITDANALAGTDTINITATGTINLNSTLDSITTSMTITGPGASQLTVNRAMDVFTILNISGAGVVVSISGVTINNGLPQGAGNGGNVHNSSGATTNLTNCIVTAGSTTSGSGAGIANEATATMTLIGVTVSANKGFSNGSDGGGIYNAGALTLTNSTVTGNTASATGGISNSGTLNMSGSTVSGNHGGAVGGIRNSS
jgi:hypothetical protein